MIRSEISNIVEASDDPVLALQGHEHISCLFITYNRSDLLVITYTALRNAISRMQLMAEFIVADDNSSLVHQKEISKIGFDTISVARSNAGLGANQNRGLALCKGQFFLQIQDDWLFIGDPMDLADAIALLKSDPDIGIVQLTPVHSDLPFERRKIGSHEFVVFKNDGLPWLRNCGVRPYSDCPHIKRFEFVEDLGPYLEGVPMAVCENDYKRRVARQNRWKVAQLVGSSTFKHLGEEVSHNPGGKRHPVIKAMLSLPVGGKMLERAVRKVYVQLDHAAAVGWSFLRGR